MIREWRLGQFKSVGKPRPFSLRPLTVFAGANSSGKSSVLQSILLITQTLASKVTQRQLVLNGELLKLGTFEDVLSRSCGEEEITIGFSIAVESSPRATRVLQRGMSRRYYPSMHMPLNTRGDVSVDLTFGPSQVEEKEGDAKFRTLQARLLRATYHADVKYPAANPPGEFAEIVDLSLKRRSEQDLKDLFASFHGKGQTDKSLPDDRLLQYEAKLSPEESLRVRRSRPGRLYGVDLKGELVAASLDHFLPYWLIVSVPSAMRRLQSYLDQLSDRGVKQEKLLEDWASSQTDPVQRVLANVIIDFSRRHSVSPEHALASIDVIRRPQRKPPGEPLPAFDVFKEVMSQLERPEKLTKDVEPIDLPDALNLLCASVADSFSSVRYLGPLRDDPKPVYGIASSADPSDVGVKGEYTAAVLDLYATHPVDFISPVDPANKIIQCQLRDAVLAWLNHFEIAKLYETREEGKLGHRLLIRPSGIDADLDLTNVGVGVSQVLPIVVMSLISDPGAVLLFEQPELHLHPKVQSLLADFFVAVIKTGRQCIIETHSEYLINRLRLRSAEAGWDTPIHDKIMLYFVERSGSTSEFRPVELNEFGAIPEWPRGFFDQGPTESDRIMKAAVQKKKTQPRAS